MAKGTYLGEFEQIVLLALAGLGEGAYGKAIFEEISRGALRDVSLTAVYITLSRLEMKGLVRSTLSEASPNRGGKPRKFFQLQSEGAAALRRSRRLIDRLWENARLHPDLSEN